ncbi:methylated-DNA--protein-cysteine methyltransferase [Mantella aurantiaca]
MSVMGGSCKVEEVHIKSPIGDIRVTACKEGLHRILLKGDYDPLSGSKGDFESFKVCDGPKEMNAPLELCLNWLQSYFCEPWLTDKLPVPPFHHLLFQQDSFTRTVLLTLQKKVKMGETISYKALAEVVGNVKAVRAVGGAMRTNPVPLIIPCHRVILSDGKIGNYAGGKRNNVKHWLLSHEKAVKET